MRTELSIHGVTGLEYTKRNLTTLDGDPPICFGVCRVVIHLVDHHGEPDTFELTLYAEDSEIPFVDRTGDEAKLMAALDHYVKLTEQTDL